MVEFVICFKDYAELLMLCKALLSTSQQGYQSKSGKKKCWWYSRWMKVIHPQLFAGLFVFCQDFFFFLTSHLHPLDLPISLSASNLTEIKDIFPWAVSVFFLCFLKPFIYSPLAPTRGRHGRPIPPRLLMQHPPEMLLKSPLPRPWTINYPVTSL